MNKKGITLTELIVASILIGIVMIGVASFAASIQRLHNSTSRTTLLAMKTMAAMNLLTRDAYQAIGEESNRGIIVRDINPFKSICFRHDVNDPSSYADDQWTCYFFEANNNSRTLYLCTVPTPIANVPPNNGNKCDAGTPRRPLLTLDPALADFYQIVEDGNGRLESIDFTLAAIFNPDIVSEPKNPITNPVYTITTSVSPPGHSR